MARNLILVGLLVALPAAAAASPGDGADPASDAEPQVVGGTRAADGAWPDTAGIVFGQDVQCSGVLVAPNLVLTAGHCAGGIDAVVLDTIDLNDAREIIPVIQEVPYPQWWQSYDATLLVLESNASVAPRTIAGGCVRDRYLVDGAPVQIVGYGAVNETGTQYTPYLMEARTTITDADCSSVDRGCESSVSPGGELGAGGGGIDTCYGDSGGPLYLITEKGTFLAGLTSRAWSDVTIDCAEGGIYVRPDAIMDWIETTAGVDLPDASCNAPPVPTAGPIDAESGSDGTTQVLANDPDAGDTHTYAIGDAPLEGTAEVAPDGLVTYHAPDGYAGEDTFTVVVTDSGDPNASGSVTILATVVDAGGCGCRASSTPRSAGGTLLLGLVALLVLRRRTR